MIRIKEAHNNDLFVSLKERREGVDIIVDRGGRSDTRRRIASVTGAGLGLFASGVGFFGLPMDDEGKIKIVPDDKAAVVNEHITSTSGYAKICSSGDYAKIGSTGNDARIGVSGNYAQIRTSGRSIKIGASSDYSSIAAEGVDAVIASAGLDTVARGKNGTWISLAEFENGGCVGFATGCIGQDGLKENVFYKAKGGKLVEVS